MELPDPEDGNSPDLNAACGGSPMPGFNNSDKFIALAINKLGFGTLIGVESLFLLEDLLGAGGTVGGSGTFFSGLDKANSKSEGPNLRTGDCLSDDFEPRLLREPLDLDFRSEVAGAGTVGGRGGIDLEGGNPRGKFKVLEIRGNGDALIFFGNTIGGGGIP